MARKPGGIGAVGSAKARFFHPSKHIRDKYPNQHASIRLSGVLVVGKGVERVNRKDQLCYRVRIPEFDDSTVFHICVNNFKIEEAPPTPFEDEVTTAQATGPTPEQDEQANLRAATEDFAGNISARAQEVAELRQEGITVDDDNEPAQENAQRPDPSESAVGQWCIPTVCPRKADVNCQDTRGTWINHSWLKIKEMDELALFRMCFPERWAVETVIPVTNRELEGKPLTLSEFYCWLGCHFFMACFEGISDRRMWWSQRPVSISEGAPFRLQEYMTYTRYKDITAAMRYTDIEPPPFLDRFHDMRQMQDAFNEHYEREYSPSWLSCLDESMNPWLDKYCPGFMSVPRKPHPLGNEYHSIADGDDGKPIMWRVKIQEGKDRPKDDSGKWGYPSKFEGKNEQTGRKFTVTSTLMCEMTKPLHGTGKVVSMDSGFCVAVGIMHLHDLGVFGQALIKKRKYWPKHVPGDMIDRYFKEKPLGSVMTLRQQIEGITFNVHCTRDDKFVTKLMSTHGLLAEVPDHKTYRQKNGEWVSFNYTEPLSIHNRCKHWVDDVNNRRHDPIGLEQVWHTKWWPTRQFTFFCSLAESNAVHSRARARGELPSPQLEFRRALALKLMTNMIADDGRIDGSPMRSRKRRRCSRGSPVVEHVLETRPPFTGIWNPSLKNFGEVSTMYAKIKCSGCNNRIRTYCRCNKALSLCTQCFAAHMVEVNNTL